MSHIVRSGFDQEPALSYQSFYSLEQERTIPIKSPAGQAQYILDDLCGRIPPEEWLLLCRFANTIGIDSDDQELRELLRLGSYLYNTRFETQNGYVNPLVAREVEKEIILRAAPDYAAGWDMTPAMKLLAEYEGKTPVFTQPERNLLLRHAFIIGDSARTEEIASRLAEKQMSLQELADVCQEIEQTELEWAGLETMDGICFPPTKAPQFRMSLQDCELEDAHYPPFAYYPAVQLPYGAVILLNGTILYPDMAGWWYSGTQKIDQTYTVQRHYKRSEHSGQAYEISEAEYQRIYQG